MEAITLPCQQEIWLKPQSRVQTGSLTAPGQQEEQPTAHRGGAHLPGSSPRGPGHVAQWQGLSEAGEEVCGACLPRLRCTPGVPDRTGSRQATMGAVGWWHPQGHLGVPLCTPLAVLRDVGKAGRSWPGRFAHTEGVRATVPPGGPPPACLPAAFLVDVLVTSPVTTQPLLQMRKLRQRWKLPQGLSSPPDTPCRWPCWASGPCTGQILWQAAPSAPQERGRVGLKGRLLTRPVWLQ